VRDMIMAGVRRSTGRVGRLASAAAVTVLTVALIAGCGSKSASGNTASSGSSFSAYLGCLRSHGVNVPTSRPSGAPGSGFGGGFGGGSGGSSSSNSTFQKASQACASLRPSFGGFGGGGGGFSGFATAFKAFRACMADHGVTIPTTRPAEPPQEDNTSPDDRFLNGLNPNNAKVAAALKACESKLPSFAQSQT